MDLSNLGNDLPLSQALSESEMQAMNRELSEEFKIGARSIAALYRLSTSKTQMVRAKGYLDAVNDVLAMLETTDSIETIKEALVRKKADLTGQKQEVNIGDLNSGQFTINKPSQHSFPLTKPPMSIQLNLKHPPSKLSKSKKVSRDEHQGHEEQHDQDPVEDVAEEEEEADEEDEASDDDDMHTIDDSLKRKLYASSSLNNVKKFKYDNLY